MKRLFAVVTNIACACTLAAALPVVAQTYPNKPVRFIVPFPPGGGTDAFARIIGAKLAEIYRQQFIIDNRSGAQGNIGTALGAKAPADGYTITLAHQGALVINPHLYSDPGFDTLRDFAAVARGMGAASVLVVHPSVPARSMKELAELAKRNPGKLTFASTASGQQLLGELFKLATGTDLVHVPYKGAGPAVLDLLAGNVSMMFANPTTTVPNVKAGKLRGLAVLGTKRNEALPDVPTAVEAGYPELSDVMEWYGVVVPAATPRAIVDSLNGGIVRALASSDVVSRMNGIGQSPWPSTPDEFARQIHSEYERWGRVVKASGAKVD
ncbi:MAG TPA: tripartite tricarboxylate transporter substrate binding protein [Burkholderiales bacterium]|nr:tripartite tricarboxylate transporter substrate binding protein [Burkholderiales bacterium]